MLLAAVPSAAAITFGAPEDLGPMPTVNVGGMSSPNAHVDASGRPTVVWLAGDAQLTEISARRFDGGAWSARQPIARVFSPQILRSSIDADGVVSAIWVDAGRGSQLSAARFNGAWQGPFASLSTPGERVSEAYVASGAAGQAVVAWTVRDPAGGRYTVKARWFSGGAWGPEQVIGVPTGPPQTAQIALAMDRSGVATLVVRDARFNLFISRGQGVFPALRPLPGAPQVTGDFVAETNAAGQVTVAAQAQGGNNPVVYWQHLGGAWSAPVTLPSRNQVAAPTVVPRSSGPFILALNYAELPTQRANVEVSMTPVGTGGQTTWPAAWAVPNIVDIGPITGGVDSGGVVTFGQSYLTTGQGTGEYHVRQWSPTQGAQAPAVFFSDFARVGASAVAPNGSVIAAVPMGDKLLAYRSAPTQAAVPPGTAATPAPALCSQTFYQQGKRTIRWNKKRKAYKVVSRIRVFNDAQSRCRTKLSIIYRNANTKVSLAQKPGSSLGYRKLKGKNFNAPVISWPNKKEMRFTTGDISGQNRKNARLVLVSYVKKTKAVPKKLRDLELVIVRRIPRNPAAAKSGSNPLFAQKNSFRAGKAWAGVS